MTTKMLTIPGPAGLAPAINLDLAGLLARGFGILVGWQKRFRDHLEMQRLEDWQLNDVGLSRAHINTALAADATTPIWDQFAR